MKILGKGLLMLAAFSFGLSSCSDESPWTGSDSEGGINLNFSSDARVMRQTRADDGVSPVVPDASQFNVSLVKSDNSFSKKWASVEAFNRESSFAIGDYTLSAFYGDAEKEGFELPCFQGSATVHVSPGETSEVSIVATLANAMVSVRYTDAFKENFSAYSAAVQTEGHDNVIFAQSETRPAYVHPSKVNLNLTLTNLNGEKVTIQPANFVAAPRHHYVVTVGVKGNVSSGDLALDVVFDDDVVAEVVNVSLGDELYSAPAPSVKAKGFDPETAIETIETDKVDSETEFHVFSFGGLKSATLNLISSKNYAPAFGRNVQLVNADELTQSQLKSEGVQCSGFFKNVDKMAVVNLTKFLAKLPADEYTVELVAVDAQTRVSDPVKLSVKVNPLLLTLESAGNVPMLSEQLKVKLTTNSKSAAERIKFQVPNANNQMVNATVLDMIETTAAGRASDFTFEYTLALAPQIRDFIDVVAILDKRAPETIKVPMLIPDYTIDADAFARKVVLRVNASNDAEAKSIADNLTFYNNDKQIPTANIYHSGSNLITVVGLNPATTYSAFTAQLGSQVKNIKAFTTEAETNLPNGDFSALGTEYKFDKIQVGGLWYISGSSWYEYTNYCNIDRFAPKSWATLNDLTAYSGASNMNSWFIVPSTFVENNQTTIRTVGYSHNGSTPAKEASSTGKYYNPKSVSADDLAVAAGELFLGSYSFNGSESRTDGIEFSTRPSSLNFSYRYTPLNDENGVVVISVYGADGAVLAQATKTLEASGSATECSLKLPGYEFGKKAAKIYVSFKSSAASSPAIHIPTGDELNEGVSYSVGRKPNWCQNKSDGKNLQKTFAKGSELVITNVKLGYETGATANTVVRAPRKTSKRK